MSRPALQGDWVFDISEKAFAMVDLVNSEGQARTHLGNVLKDGLYEVVEKPAAYPIIVEMPQDSHVAYWDRVVVYDERQDFEMRRRGWAPMPPENESAIRSRYPRWGKRDLKQVYSQFREEDSQRPLAYVLGFREDDPPNEEVFVQQKETVKRIFRSILPTANRFEYRDVWKCEEWESQYTAKEPELLRFQVYNTLKEALLTEGGENVLQE